MKLSEQTMKKLRGRLGLDTCDTSRDEEIKKIPPVEIVREAVAWTLGNYSWADYVACLMREAGVSPEDFV